ncbi:MAG: hypothetical protein ACLQG5_00545 [Methanobacterium sp.]
MKMKDIIELNMDKKMIDNGEEMKRVNVEHPPPIYKSISLVHLW